MLLCLEERPRRFLWCCCIFILFADSLHFIFLSFVDDLHSHFLFDITPYPSVDYRQVNTHFILSVQLIAEWFATLSFSTIERSSYCERYGFEWTFFTHRHFLPYAPLPKFLTQPAFIKDSLWASSSSLKVAGPPTEVWNTDTAHLFV